MKDFTRWFTLTWRRRPLASGRPMMEVGQEKANHGEQSCHKDAPAHEQDKDQYDIGILFVHGMGQQTRGDTLVRCGEPLIKWVNEWTWTEDAVEVVSAFLNPVPEDPTAPPHATLKGRLPNDQGANQEVSWLLAESWWADTFAVPSFSNLAHWGFTALPWIIISHFGTLIRRFWLQKPSGMYRSLLWRVSALLIFPIYLVLSVFLSTVVFVLMLLLLVLALLPIPQLRPVLVSIQKKLSAIVGDSYVLLQSPVQAAAIKTQVARDLDWLVAKCRAVAVVAHSQGGAVAYETLRQGSSIQASPPLHARLRPQQVVKAAFGETVRRTIG